MKIKIFCTLLFSTIFFFSCEKNDSISGGNTNGKQLFTLLKPADTGIDFANNLQDDPNSNSNILSFTNYYHGGGVAIADINNDGLQDVFLTGNEVPNRLYLNKGDMKFEDITKTANINKNKVWSTGVSAVDFNNDGYMDFHVAQYGPGTPETRKNLVYLNNKNLTFTEVAGTLGLDDMSRSTHAAFFDYDKDGDLDCYVLNESRYAQVVLSSVFEHLEADPKHLAEASGNLFRNDRGRYTKVTEAAGVMRYGYGLGLAVSDINNDGWLDIYVANDFSVPDFLFINNQNGTFTDKIKDNTERVSFYAMGIDIADINNDGLDDISVVDMAANDHIRDKTLMPSMNTRAFQTYTEGLNYQYQYMFNSLQLNNGNNTFSNIADMAGTARTDWSWATLLADFDNDGLKDNFVTNGYRRYHRNSDFRNDLAKIRKQYNGKIPAEKRAEIYSMIPEIKLPNIMYRNNGDLTFTEKQTEWGTGQPSYSNGAAYADLDNDGDLDLIVTNIDEPVFVYRNNARQISNASYLQVKLDAPAPLLPGTRATIYTAGGLQTQTYNTTRGYLSSVDNRLHFGLGKQTTVDSIQIKWLNGKSQTIVKPEINQMLTVSSKDAQTKSRVDSTKETLALKANPKDYGLNFSHRENDFNDFEKEVLLPHKQSALGPFISTGDADGNGTEDFFIGGAKGQTGLLYLQSKSGKFSAASSQPWSNEQRAEDMGSLFFDYDADGDNDLYVISGGGGDFAGKADDLQDRLYENTGAGVFKKTAGVLPKMKNAGTKIKAVDYDADGDLDLFIGGAALPGRYPYADRSYLLRNDGNKFVDVTKELIPRLAEDSGIIKDVIWTDLNADGQQDLIVAGEWTAIRVFINEGTKFSEKSTEYGTDNLRGWWYSLAATDIDNDGDVDLVAGNVGLNTKFHADTKKPFTVYADDFDSNGTTDVVLTKDYKGKAVPIRGKQCSSEQMPFIAEKFPTYNGFANAGVEDILGKEKLDKALKLEANEFRSLVLLQESGKFTIKYLPNTAQVAPINGIIVCDINKDGKTDLLIGGNNYDTEIETPRYDAGQGLILIGEGNGNFESLSTSESGLNTSGNVKDLAKISGAGKFDYLISGVNNSQIQLHTVIKE